MPTTQETLFARAAQLDADASTALLRGRYREQQLFAGTATLLRHAVPLVCGVASGGEAVMLGRLAKQRRQQAYALALTEGLTPACLIRDAAATELLAIAAQLPAAPETITVHACVSYGRPS